MRYVKSVIYIFDRVCVCELNINTNINFYTLYARDVTFSIYNSFLSIDFTRENYSKN